MYMSSRMVRSLSQRLSTQTQLHECNSMGGLDANQANKFELRCLNTWQNSKAVIQHTRERGEIKV